MNNEIFKKQNLYVTFNIKRTTKIIKIINSNKTSMTSSKKYWYHAKLSA